MIAILALAATLAMQCPVERAHYVLRNNPEISADFRAIASTPDWPSGLALAVHGKSGETSWWLPWNGGTDGLQHVASTVDVESDGWKPPSPDGGPRPFGDRQYLGTDAAYTVIDHVPHKGEMAPAHMLFPDSAGSRDTVFPQKQYFDFANCSADPG